MNPTAGNAPRSWTPQIILFSIVFHIVLLYYVAVAFQVVPQPNDPSDDRPMIDVFRLPPPPPPPAEPEKIIKQPRVRPRDPIPQPEAPPVPPIPLPPQPPAISTANADTMVLNAPIQEVPIVQGLPRYPRVAEARQIEGKVRLAITIMPDGSVRDVRVVSAKPSGYFEAEAIRAVQSWRYKPSNITRQNVIVDIDFVLS